MYFFEYNQVFIFLKIYIYTHIYIFYKIYIYIGEERGLIYITILLGLKINVRFIQKHLEFF